MWLRRVAKPRELRKSPELNIPLPQSTSTSDIPHSQFNAPDSRLQRQLIVDRLPPADRRVHAPFVHQHFAREAAGDCSSTPSTDPYAPASRIATRSPTSSRGSRRSRPTTSLLSQTGPTISYSALVRGAVVNRLDAVVRAVQRRPHQLRHPRIDDREFALFVPRLQIGDPREERACRAGNDAARLDDHRQVRVAHLGRRAPPRTPRWPAAADRRRECRGLHPDRRTRAGSRPRAASGSCRRRRGRHCAAARAR